MLRPFSSSSLNMRSVIRRDLELAVKYYKKASERAKSEGALEALPALNNSLAHWLMLKVISISGHLDIVKMLDIMGWAANYVPILQAFLANHH